ncbi:MAG: aminodeoxychorismate synthase component I [Planctomycetia bacterium]|nr:aminodeoxychorismate synthase component I [Planctomycetia bacterium]
MPYSPFNPDASCGQAEPAGAKALRGASHHLLEELELKLPFWRYHEIYAASKYSFLLDSAKDAERLGQFSFIGGEPWLVYRAKRQPGQPPQGGARIEVIRLRGADGRLLDMPVTESRIADPFEDLKGVLAEWAIDYRAYADHPLPLLSGAVGYFGYEAGYFIEELPDRGVDDLGLPDIYFMFVDAVLGHCHRTGKSYLSIVGRGENDVVAQQNAAAMRDEMFDRVRAYEARTDLATNENSPTDAGESGALPQPPATGPKDVEIHAMFDQSAYCRAVEQVKEHVLAGDIFEGCLTHRFDSPLCGGTPWELYQELRRINPAPFASYLNFPEAQVVCSSPERYVSLSPERVAESRPIKGTRPRGQTPEQDAALWQELFSSVKDRAENVMVVDLVRSDFGRVCKFHTIHVPELMAIEKYATVYQMVSTIRGELADGVHALDLVKATFPGGSMTGAPKIEAMKIIDSLEPVKRGIYSGSIGYLDFAGPMDLNIVIRTFVIRNGRCYYNVGGAVVADSDPKSEYQETLDKARALIQALGNLAIGCQLSAVSIQQGERVPGATPQ